jgi:hypothetical protein
MTTIKTWEARYKDEPVSMIDAFTGEITDLRAAVERKDALLLDLKGYFDEGSYQFEAITKELE